MVPTMCVISIIPPGGHSYKMAHLRSLWQQQHSEGEKKKKKKVNYLKLSLSLSLIWLWLLWWEEQRNSSHFACAHATWTVELCVILLCCFWLDFTLKVDKLSWFFFVCFCLFPGVSPLNFSISISSSLDNHRYNLSKEIKKWFSQECKYFLNLKVYMPVLCEES